MGLEWQSKLLTALVENQCSDLMPQQTKIEILILLFLEKRFFRKEKHQSFISFIAVRFPSVDRSIILIEWH